MTKDKTKLREELIELAENDEEWEQLLTIQILDLIDMLNDHGKLDIADVLCSLMAFFNCVSYNDEEIRELDTYITTTAFSKIGI